jgi:hypothetical protein
LLRLTQPFTTWLKWVIWGRIKTTLDPLLETCQNLIPKASLEYTPVFALLGGGVRALRAPLRRNLMTVVHQVFLLSCFRTGPQNASVLLLSPEQEAIYGYVSAGVLTNRPIDQFRSVFYADEADTATAVRGDAATALDHGVFNGTKLPVDAQQVTIGNKWSPLIEYLRQLPDNSALRIEYPCLLTGYERQDSIVTARGQLRRFTIVGTGNGTACASLLTTVLTRVRSQSSTRQITLPSGEYVALGGLEASLREVRAAERQVSVDELRDAAFVACRKTWQDARTAAPSVTTDDDVAFSCSRAVWLSVVLRNVYDTTSVRFALESLDRASIVSATRGFVEEQAPLLPVGAPPRGVRCEELEVDMVDLTLPRIIIYQCDCITFTNYQLDTVRYVSSSKLLNDVMPQFASMYLYPPRMVAANSTLYPQSEFRVCSSTSTPPGVYIYHDDVREEAQNELVVRKQRNFGDE